MSNITIKSKVPHIKQFVGGMNPFTEYNNAADNYEKWLLEIRNIEIEAIHVSDDGKIITIFYNSAR